jgi:hypothetical protein
MMNCDECFVVSNDDYDDMDDMALKDVKAN